jgi:hypothetical protein
MPQHSVADATQRQQDTPEAMLHSMSEAVARSMGSMLLRFEEYILLGSQGLKERSDRKGWAAFTWAPSFKRKGWAAKQRGNTGRSELTPRFSTPRHSSVARLMACDDKCGMTHAVCA